MSEPLLLRIEEVARQLQISRSMAYLLVQKGRIPAIRLGKSVRVPQDALVTWVRNETVGIATTAAETELDEDFTSTGELFNQAGFDNLGRQFTIQEAAPALKKLAQLLKGRTTLDRRLAREECIRRLTRAGVRTPKLMIDAALRLTPSMRRTTKRR